MSPCSRVRLGRKRNYFGQKKKDGKGGLKSHLLKKLVIKNHIPQLMILLL